jgi:hypothetical protein
VIALISYRALLLLLLLLLLLHSELGKDWGR